MSQYDGQFRSFNFGSENPKVNWFSKDKLRHLKFSTVTVVGYELRHCEDGVNPYNATGNINNTARQVGTDRVNADGIRYSFLSKGICTSVLPPVILDTGELIDGFTRHSVLLDLEQEYYVYLVVKLNPGYTIDDARDQLGLGLNDHLQQKPATLQDFKVRLTKWIERQATPPSSARCKVWFENINHSFDSSTITRAITEVFDKNNAKQTMESYNKPSAKRKGATLLDLDLNEVVAFDNKSGASIARGLLDIFTLYRETNYKIKPKVVGFLTKTPADKAYTQRQICIKDVNDINETFIELVELATGEGKNNFKLMDLVGFVPQIIDVEDGNSIVSVEENLKRETKFSFLNSLINDPEEDLEENEEG